MLRLISRNLALNRLSLVRRIATKMTDDRIVWMDMEMTGLEVDRCRVLQVALIVTDSHLNIISPEFAINIHQNQAVLDSMNDWCKENLKDVAESSLKSEITETKAEDMMLEFISKFIPTPQASPLAGNTIYMDRMFLKKYFPKVDQHLHYRLIDVSTLKELCHRWNKPVYDKAPKKELKHRALSDIIESINELKYYKESFMNIQP